jgi:hypothetical protein
MKKMGFRLGKKREQNGIVLELSEPGQNRFNRAGSRFSRSNRRFPVFGHFFQIFSFLREPNRIRHRSPIEPVEPAGPVRFLKPWICHTNGIFSLNGVNFIVYTFVQNYHKTNFIPLLPL